MDYHRGKVLEVLDEGVHYDEFTQLELPYQSVKAELDNGEVVVVDYGDVYGLQAEQLVQTGDAVVIVEAPSSSGTQYSIIDHYRLPWLWFVIGLFAIVVIVCTRWRGIGALVSVGISLLVLVKWLVPQLLQTDYPLLITFGTLAGLAIVTFYLGHGTSSHTTLALVCTVAALGLAMGTASFTTWLLDLSGVGSEAALSLKYGFGQDIHLSGLLLAGLLIGALGILDDVTTAQVQAVSELKQADPSLSWQQLFFKAYRIGQAHIVSLVNTLILVYAGAALPAFAVLSTYSVQPFWVALNSETLMEEIVQMFVGSFTLVLAVPFTTLVAAWWISTYASESARLRR